MAVEIVVHQNDRQIGRVIDDPNAEFAQGPVQLRPAGRSHQFDLHAGIPQVLRGGFVSETEARPEPRCRFVDQVCGNHEAAIEQARDGFIDLAARKFAGQRVDNGFRMLALADAGGDGTVKLPPKKNLAVFRIEADAVRWQHVHREMRREPDLADALLAGALFVGLKQNMRMRCWIVSCHRSARASRLVVLRIRWFMDTMR